MAATVEGSPALAVAEAAAEPELPKAAVQRLVKAKMAQVMEGAHKGAPESKPALNLHKDALLAFQESGRVFINYLASTANDFAKEGKRVTLSPEDVFKALEELEFNEFLQPLRQYLEAHRSKGKEKSAAKKKEGASTAKKRKAASAPAAADEAEGEGEDHEMEDVAGQEAAEQQPAAAAPEQQPAAAAEAEDAS